MYITPSASSLGKNAKKLALAIRLYFTCTYIYIYNIHIIRMQNRVAATRTTQRTKGCLVASSSPHACFRGRRAACCPRCCPPQPARKRTCCPFCVVSFVCFVWFLCVLLVSFSFFLGGGIHKEKDKLIT